MTFLTPKVNDKQDFGFLIDAMTHTKLFSGERTTTALKISEFLRLFLDNRVRFYF